MHRDSVRFKNGVRAVAEATNRLGERWSDEEKARLRAFQVRGDYHAALTAFPGRTPGAVSVAFRRCTSRPDDSRPPTSVDCAAARMKLRLLSLEVLIDGLADLLDRRVDFERPRRPL